MFQKSYLICLVIFYSYDSYHLPGNELMEVWVLTLPFEFVHQYYLEPYYSIKVSVIC